MARVASASTASKERLERISHHFLSGTGDGPAAGPRTPVLVPVVTVPGASELPLERLSQALLARGRPSVVLDARRDARDTSRPSPSTEAHRDTPVPPGTDAGGGGPAPAPAPPAEAVEAAKSLKPAPDICLVPVPADAWPLPGAFARPLFVLPATTDGVREAYLCAKQAHAWGLTGTLGVIVADAPDNAAAARHFDALSDALWRFLGLAAISYGALPAPPPPHGPVDLLGPGQGDPIDAALGGMARLLAADLPESEPERAPAHTPASAPRSKSRQAT